MLGAVTDRTVLAMIDTVTSPTGLLMPYGELTAQLEGHGVAVLLDAAHGIGMVPLDLDELGASYTTSNCHKWLCAPKGSAFLHVRKDKQADPFDHAELPNMKFHRLLWVWVRHRLTPSLASACPALASPVVCMLHRRGSRVPEYWPTPTRR